MSALFGAFSMPVAGVQRIQLAAYDAGVRRTAGYDCVTRAGLPVYNMGGVLGASSMGKMLTSGLFACSDGELCGGGGLNLLLTQLHMNHTNVAG